MAALIASSPISPLAPLVLLVMLGGSCAVFWMLVRRWTVHRQWMSLSDWADATAFALRGEQRAEIPEILASLGEGAPRVLLSLSSPNATIVQVETPNISDVHMIRPRWNLLVRKLPMSWALTVMRPVAHAASAIDLLPAGEFRSISHGERFIVSSVSSAAAAAINKSSARALLPADVGLILIDQNLILDFSTRPFDPLELHRINDLAEQLANHLQLRNG